jgi:hypothetical protein
MKVAVASSILVAFLEATGTISLESAPEPVWMLLWGIILLGLAAVARSMLQTRQQPTHDRGVTRKYDIRKNPQSLEGRA